MFTQTIHHSGRKRRTEQFGQKDTLPHFLCARQLLSLAYWSVFPSPKIRWSGRKRRTEQFGQKGGAGRAASKPFDFDNFEALRQLCSICPDQQILDGPNDCLTMAAKNRLHSNAIWFREEDQQQQHQKVSGTAKNAKKTTIRGGRNKRSVVLQEQTR
uniref:Uncharacterized protein n=1 Tax=Globodera rostochiensis TaxID=31243 RepID=A0A914I3C8_GLORO